MSLNNQIYDLTFLFWSFVEWTYESMLLRDDLSSPRSDLKRFTEI